MLSIERITDAIAAVTKSFANLTISHLKALVIDETLTVAGNADFAGTLAAAGLNLDGALATTIAAGSVQGDATALSQTIEKVSGADETKGVVLPAAVLHTWMLVYNLGTAALKVYPASGDDINDGTADVAVVLGGHKAALFYAIDSSTWVMRGEDLANVSVTATTGGGTTGLIPAGTKFCTVTSDSADKQISLPAATIGDRIRILVGATGCELISAVAAHKVNDVTVGATNEAALTAENLYDCQYVAVNTWVVIGYTKLGAVQAALVPDSL